MSGWTLTYEARPWTSNDERRWHWRKRSEAVKEWRQAFWALAKSEKVPACERVAIDVTVEVKSRKSMPDPMACAGAVKAAIDGIVDAKVIPNDTGAEVAWVRFWPPAVGKRDALTLRVLSCAGTPEPWDDIAWWQEWADAAALVLLEAGERLPGDLVGRAQALVDALPMPGEAALPEEVEEG